MLLVLRSLTRALHRALGCWLIFQPSSEMMFSFRAPHPPRAPIKGYVRMYMISVMQVFNNYPHLYYRMVATSLVQPSYCLTLAL